MRVVEALGIIDGGEEGGGGDGADAGDGAQARHARILDGEVFDHGVGVRELVAGREPRPCRETSHEFDFFGASCATEICGRTDGVANAGNESDPIFLERMHLRELRNRSVK